jgi:hypothetical protein
MCHLGDGLDGISSGARRGPRLGIVGARLGGQADPPGQQIIEELGACAAVFLLADGTLGVPPGQITQAGLIHRAR